MQVSTVSLCNKIFIDLLISWIYNEEKTILPKKQWHDLCYFKVKAVKDMEITSD